MISYAINFKCIDLVHPSFMIWVKFIVYVFILVIKYKLLTNIIAIMNNIIIIILLLGLSNVVPKQYFGGYVFKKKFENVFPTLSERRLKLLDCNHNCVEHFRVGFNISDKLTTLNVNEKQMMIYLTHVTEKIIAHNVNIIFMLKIYWLGYSGCITDISAGS